MCHNARAAAMHGNLHVVPLVCRPGSGIAGNIGTVPVRLIAGLVGVIPGLRDTGTLGAKDDRLTVGHNLVHIHLQVLYL